ncbi:hypothetical protein CsSME_00006126 [Camellia sinensis var. sinensis]
MDKNLQAAMDLYYVMQICEEQGGKKIKQQLSLDMCCTSILIIVEFLDMGCRVFSKYGCVVFHKVLIGREEEGLTTYIGDGGTTWGLSSDWLGIWPRGVPGLLNNFSVLEGTGKSF